MSKRFRELSHKLTEAQAVVEEGNKPTNPELWARAKSMAKKKFDVYPSAYANGWASKWYKSKGGGWKTVSEEVEHLTELSPKTLGSYVKKASKDASDHSFDHGDDEHRQYGTPGHDPDADKDLEDRERKIQNRQKGVNTATNKLVKKATNEEATYTEAVVRLNPKSFLKVKGPSSAYDAGYTAAKSGKKYGENPHPRGSKEHLDWSKAHNTARANKIHGEEVDLEEGHYEVVYKHPQYKNHRAHVIKAKNEKHAESKFLSYGNPYQVKSVRKVQMKDIDEEVKQIDEISKQTAHSYVKKGMSNLTGMAADRALTKDRAERDELNRKIKNRKQGLSQAVNKLAKEDAEIPALMKKPVEEGYYKTQQINKMEDERLAKQKKASTGFAKGPHPDLLKKAREWDKKHPLPKWQDKTPKGYGPNEEVHPDTYKAQSVYDNAHKAATKKGHSEMEAHKQASAVMKKKHPGFSATRGEGQVYKESAADRMLKLLKQKQSEKNWASNIKVPDYSQVKRKEPIDLSKVNTVKEAYKNAKKKMKEKPETFQAEPELKSDINKDVQ